MLYVGRRKKPEEEKAKTHAIRWPPELWARVEAMAGKLGRKRTQIIHEGVEKELTRLERQIKREALEAARPAAPTAPPVEEEG